MPPAETSATDPICGKPVDPLRARAVGIFGGVTYYFCSADCKSKFQDPRRAPRPDAAPPTKAQKAQRAAASASKETAPEPRVTEPERAQARPAHAMVVEAVNLHDGVGDGYEATNRGDEDRTPASGGWGRAWWIVGALFAIAGVVLFFSMRAHRP